MSIATEITRIQQAKADIKTAIEAKGVSVPSSALIDTYDDYVSQISAGGSTADTEALKGLIQRDLTSIDIPSGTTKIGDYAFANSGSLSAITIPDTVTSITNYAFYGASNLMNIEIPNSVTSIGQYAFTNCTALPSITIPSGVTSIGNNVFYGCRSLTSVDIPNSVTTIGSSAFGSCSGLTSIDIPSGVTSIGNGAFQNCSSLTSIDIPSGVTSISSSILRNCSGLTAITLTRVTPPTLNNQAFDNTNNCPIYVPEESVSAYKSASGWSNYASRIQALPFLGKWKATYSGGSVTTADCDSTSAISQNEIAKTGLTSVEIGNCVTGIGESAFDGYASLTSVTIGNSVLNMGFSSFYGCSSLSEITIPDSVTTIANSAFQDCSGLTHIDIGSGVTSINSGNVFKDCTSLTGITINAATPPTIRSSTFSNTNNCPIYVPAESVNLYKTAQYWSTYASRIQAIP